VTGLATGVVVTVNVAEEAPTGTVTEAGTEAALLLELRLTVTADPATTPARVTVPDDEPPPTTDDGVNVTLERFAAVTVRFAVNVFAPCVAVIVTGIPAVTGWVETVNVAEDAPAGMVTVEGTEAAKLLALRLTASPPVGAVPFIVSVPVAVLPPAIELGVTLIPPNAPGVTVMVVLTVAPFNVPVSVTVVTLVTALVLMEKRSEVAPSATSTF